MNTKVGLVWECACGNIVHGEEAPEECEKCSALDSFIEIPEDVLKSREEFALGDDEDELPNALLNKNIKEKGSEKKSKIKSQTKSQKKSSKRSKK